MLKECLKQNKISITYLSNMLDISRPTLYKLMQAYDNGDYLQEERYKIIFDTICNNKDNKTNLLTNLNRFRKLINKEKTIGAYDLSVEKSDLIHQFLTYANNDLHSDTCDEEIYRLINIIVTSYKKEPAFKMYAKYILILNGIKDKNQIVESDKPFFSNIFKVNSMYKNGSLDIDYSSLTKFYKRIEQLKKERHDLLKKAHEEIEKEINEKLKDKISAQISKRLTSGIDPENLDYDEIINNLTIE